MITISFNQTELQGVMNESPSFRSLVARTLENTQASLLVKTELPLEGRLVEQLRTYVRTHFSNTNKIAGIKYVRQWAVDNKYRLSDETYQKLYSLIGAKEFVENLLRW